jgi:copper(I)-binding protein
MKYAIKTTLMSLVGLALAACSAPEEAADTHAGMDHDSMDMAAPTPLVDDGVAPVINVRASWMRPHPNGRDVTAAYFAARLDEGNADRLLSARIDGASHVELHGHIIGEGGVMQMRPIGPQDLLSSGPLVFTPGGRHLMVHGLEPKVEGDTVTGVLVFERAGEIEVSFAVRAIPPGMPTEF